MATNLNSRFISFNGESLSFPAGQGESGYSLVTDGSGNLSWKRQQSLHVTQSSHGFSVLDCIRHNGTQWVLAQADTEDTLADGVVVTVIDTNNFIVAESGFFTVPGHGLTTGEWYFLDSAVAGNLTDITPEEFVQPLVKTLDTNNIRVIPATGHLFATGSASGSSEALSIQSNSTCTGRLTFTSNVPVLQSTVTAATTVYFTPYTGNYISLYTGTQWQTVTFTQKSLSLSGFTVNKNFDIFGYLSTGELVLEALEWTDDSTRATGLTRQDGVLVKSGDNTRRYLGTLRTTSTTGQSEFSFGGVSAGGTVANLFLWNYYNRVPTSAFVGDNTDFWSYTSATWRSANNSTSNRINFVVGVQENIIFSINKYLCGSSGYFYVGIGYDSTSAFSGTPGGAVNTAATRVAELAIQPSAGFHYVQAIESGGVAGYCYGDNGTPTVDQGGIRLMINL